MNLLDLMKDVPLEEHGTVLMIMSNNANGVRNHVRTAINKGSVIEYINTVTNAWHEMYATPELKVMESTGHYQTKEDIIDNLVLESYQQEPNAVEAVVEGLKAYNVMILNEWYKNNWEPRSDYISFGDEDES